MKTADEIKEAMLHCSPVSCRSTGCPYKADTPKYEGDMPVCRMKLWHDMRHLIQQLEAERDAAVESMRNDPNCCYHCANMTKRGICQSEPRADGHCFEWRGVQKEE